MTSLLQVQTNDENTDYYRLKIGIRTIQWTSKNLLLNNEPVYLRGFGKHEDSIVCIINLIILKHYTTKSTNIIKIYL